MAKAGLSSAERGYGHTHRLARKKAVQAHTSGDPCSRCAMPMLEDATLLDLDHADDRIGYLGLAHRSCNRASNGKHRGNLQRVCDHCGLTFTTRHRPQRYCSAECRRTAKAGPKPKRKPRRRARVCPVCLSIHFKPKYCGRDCAYKALKTQSRNRYRLRVGIPLDAPLWRR